MRKHILKKNFILILKKSVADPSVSEPDPDPRLDPELFAGSGSAIQISDPALDPERIRI